MFALGDHTDFLIILFMLSTFACNFNRTSHDTSMSNDETPVNKPNPGTLRLREKESFDPKAPARRASPKKPAAKKSSKNKQKKRNGHSRLRFMLYSFGGGIVGFTVFGLLLAHQLLEWEVVSQSDLLMGRNILLVVFFAVLIIEAFTSDLLQGILCLFFLPYTIFYGIIMCQTGALKGFTIAVVLFLGAEIYFIPDEAIVPIAHKQVNDWIKSGQDRLIYPDGRPQAGFEE